MSDKKIVIIHATDIHVAQGLEFELSARVKAFCNDINSLGLKPDCLIVSGDVSFSGKQDEFAIAHEHFFAPIIKETRLETKHVIIAPGNHDYDRALANNVIMDGVRSQLARGDDSSLSDNSLFLSVEREYRDFVKSNSFSGQGTHIFSFGAVDVGISVFSSARASVGEESRKGCAFLPVKEIKASAFQIRDCGLKIAVLHHPIDWFSDLQEHTAVDLLKEQFDIILCGHIHEGESTMNISTGASLIYGTAAAFIKGSEVSETEGYNVYEIDIESKKFVATYRRYFKRRAEYDSDNERGRGGRFELPLPEKSLQRQNSLQLATKEIEISNRLRQEVDIALSKSQHLDTPIYIEPIVRLCSLDANGRLSYTLEKRLDFASKINVFYAPRDAGVTTFFKKVCAEQNQRKRLSVIIAGSRFKDIRTEYALRKTIAKNYGLRISDVNLAEVVVFVDDLICRDNQELYGYVELLKCVEKAYISIRSRLLFDGLIRAKKNPDIVFYSFDYWSARKVKEFIEQYSKAIGWSSGDVDAVIRFIVKSLANTDVPLSPLLVGLYVHAFVKGQGSFTSLNFGELMNSIEAQCVGGSGRTGTNTVHYYQVLLQMIAKACLRKSSIMIDARVATAEFIEHIKKCGMDDATEVKINKLIEIGILSECDVDGVRYIGFTCHMFFRHYLSFGFENGDLRLEDCVGTPNKISEIGDALPYYVSRHRGDQKVLDGIISTIVEHFPDDREITPSVLEKYATNIIAPVEDKSADSKATELSEMNQDSPVCDEEMEHRQSSKIDSEERRLKHSNETVDLSNLDARIDVLGILYNVFRNLEEIPLEDKISKLDLILGFHLSCNMQLIDYFVRSSDRSKGLTSLFAYFATIGGLGFLSENIASATLKITIKSAYERATNPLKKLLLLCIEMELGMLDYIEDLPSLLQSEGLSMPLIEIGYLKLMDCLIYCKKDYISQDLIDAFKKVYDLRKLLYGQKARRGDGDPEYDNTIQTIKKTHILRMADIRKGDVSDLRALIAES